MSRPAFGIITGALIMVSTTLPALAKDLTVRITGIDTERPGNITVMLFAKDGYPKDHGKAISAQSKKADAPQIDFNFNISEKHFAIKVLHDENMDGKVAKNWTGILPAEGLGFSNGARIRFGPPSFEQSKLSLKDTANPITIKIIYP